MIVNGKNYVAKSISFDKNGAVSVNTASGVDTIENKECSKSEIPFETSKCSNFKKAVALISCVNLGLIVGYIVGRCDKH